MAKTTFKNRGEAGTGLETIPKEWLNGAQVIHFDGTDDDWHYDPIELIDLSTDLQNIINLLIGYKGALETLFYNGNPRVRLFGGTGVDGNFAGNFNLNERVYEFDEFNIAAGQTVYCERGFVRIKVKKTCTIAGSLIMRPINRHGIGKPFYNNAGQAYNPGSQPTGSGGGQAVGHTFSQTRDYALDPGGLGGGCLIIESLGKLSITGSIGVNGADALPSQIFQGTHKIGGSGGGAAGFAGLYSFTEIDVTGTVDLIGGRGGDAIGTDAAGGGGGAGGWLEAFAPIVKSLANSFNVRGGVPGQSNGAGNLPAAGGGGFGGYGGNQKQQGENGQIFTQQSPLFDWL